MTPLQITLLALESLRARKVGEPWSAEDEAEFRDIVSALEVEAERAAKLEEYLRGSNGY